MHMHGKTKTGHLMCTRSSIWQPTPTNPNPAKHYAIDGIHLLPWYISQVYSILYSTLGEALA